MVPRKIIVGYDSSPRSRSAAAWALDEAARTGATVEFFHAYELPLWTPAASMVPSIAVPPEEHIRGAIAESLREAVESARRTHPGVGTTTKVVDAHAAPALAELSAGAQMIVLGTHGYSAVPGLLGSVSVAVSAHARCPVVVVRGSATAHGPVVAGIDESAASHAVLGLAFDEAADRAAPLVVIRAWAPVVGLWNASPPRGGTVPRDLRRPFDELVAGWREKYPHVVVTTRALIEHPAAALTEAGRTAQLLVVGTHGRGALRGVVLGSVSQHLLRHADCPVAIAHERGEKR